MPAVGSPLLHTIGNSFNFLLYPGLKVCFGMVLAHF